MVQRIYTVSTLDIRKSALQTRIEILWAQITLIIAGTYSGFSFFVYIIFGGSLFRQTLNQLLKNIMQNMHIYTER